MMTFFDTAYSYSLAFIDDMVVLGSIQSVVLVKQYHGLFFFYYLKKSSESSFKYCGASSLLPPDSC